MSPSAYRGSTTLLLSALGLWGVLGFSQPRLIPGTYVVAVGVLLTALVVLSQFRRIEIPALPAILVILALASPLWAGTDVGRPRTLLFAVITAAAVIFASYWPASKAIRILDVGFKLVAVGTIVMLVGFRATSFDVRPPNEGTLIGPYVQKNILGTVLLLGLITAIYAHRWRARRLEVVVWVAVYGGLLALVRSSTASALAVLSIVLAIVMSAWSKQGRRRRSASAVLAVSGAVLLVPLLSSQVDGLLGILGRDATLSGRSRIWEGALTAWGERPLFGYGWGAAFDPANRASLTIAEFTYWAVPSAHSGYLTVALYLGWAGFAIFVAFAVMLLFRALRQAAATPTSEWRWLFQIALVFAAQNVIDTWIDNTTWFLAVAAAVWLKIQARERHAAASATLRSRPASVATYR